MMIFSTGISFLIMMISFFVIMIFSFVISLALFFMRNICCRPRLDVVVHETASEKVLLQLSGIRVDPALEFA